MTDTTTPLTRTPRRRSEGQWGLGYHEPLNPAEQSAVIGAKVWYGETTAAG